MPFVFQLVLLLLINGALKSLLAQQQKQQSKNNNLITPLKELHIGALFPMEAGSGGWPGGQACLPAVQMALDDVNMDVELLPNYALRLHYHNSKCKPGLAARQMFELLYKPPTKLILLSGCSPVTTMVAEAAPVWNLLVLSYGASSPALSNRERFPTLFRTHPSANMQNPTRVHLFEKFKWKRVTILQSVEEVFDSTAKDLEEQCREKGIRVERHSFYGDPTDALKAILRQDARIIVGLFYVTEARRVLCQAYHLGVHGRKYVWFMIGWYSDTWFVPLEHEALDCSREQMEKAVQYHFTTESVMLSRDTMPTISGMTGQDFLERLKRRITTDPQETGGWPEAPLAYDAVWALALMLNCTMGSLPGPINLDKFNYNNTFIAGKMFACMKRVQFRGVSGQVMFSDLGDRIARTQIEQMQNGKYVLLGYYDSSTQTLEWKKQERFFGGRGPPPDSTRIRNWPITVNSKLYVVGMIFVFISIALSAFLFAFNRKFSNRRIVFQSQVECNNMLILGSAICLLSLFMMGFPTASGSSGKPLLRFPSSPAWFTAFCHMRVFTLMFGFSLAYGSLFAKVWIAHKLAAAQKSSQLMMRTNQNNEEDSTSGAAQINSMASSTGGHPHHHPKASTAPFVLPWDPVRMLVAAIVTRQTVMATAMRKISRSSYGNLSSASGSRSGTAKSQLSPTNLFISPIPSTQFYLVVGTLCLFDLFLIFLWLYIDPMRKQQIHFPLQEPVGGMKMEDIMLLPVIELCQSQRHDIWTVFILGSKGLLLLLGLFLAYETRQLKIRFLNDLKFTLLSICNVGVLCLLCGPIVVFFLRTQPNPFFCFVSTTVLVCTGVSMGLIFGPKLLFIYWNPELTKEERNKQFQESTASQAEQSRYQQLLKENVELKRQIDMRNIRIQECRRILECHSLLNNLKSKTRGGNSATTKKALNKNKNNNNNINNIVSLSESSADCIPCSSGMLEFEQPTISSSVIDGPTIVTFLETQQELSTDLDMDDEHGNERNGAGGNKREQFVEVVEIEHHQPLVIEGPDTGVCSDYEEEDCENAENGGDEPMLTDSFDNQSSIGNDEEEIIL